MQAGWLLGVRRTLVAAVVGCLAGLSVSPHIPPSPAREANRLWPALPSGLPHTGLSCLLNCAGKTTITLNIPSQNLARPLAGFEGAGLADALTPGGAPLGEQGGPCWLAAGAAGVTGEALMGTAFIAPHIHTAWPVPYICTVRLLLTCACVHLVHMPLLLSLPLLPPSPSLASLSLRLGPSLPCRRPPTQGPSTTSTARGRSPQRGLPAQPAGGGGRRARRGGAGGGGYGG